MNENSFIYHNKIHNEIVFVLKGSSPITILVYHPERKEFYTRKTDITPVAGFLDYDKKCLVVSSDKIVTFVHPVELE